MALITDRCVCLRKTEFSETSQVLTLFAREGGIVRLMAKGAHRRTKAGASRFDGGIDLLDLGQAVYSGDASRELALLTDWKLCEGHLEIRKNLRAIYLGIYSAELIAMLLEEHDPHPELFDLLEGLLAALGTRTLEEEFLAFELDLLREAGFQPEIASCVNCGARADQRDRVWFSPARGGVVCRNCHGAFADRIELDARLLRIMLMIQDSGPAGSSGNPSPPARASRRLPQLTRYQTDPINRLLASHIQHSLGNQPRSAHYVLARKPPAPAFSNAPARESPVG